MQTTEAELAEKKRIRNEKAHERIKAWREIPGNRERGRKNHREWMNKPGNKVRKKAMDAAFRSTPMAKEKKNAWMRKARSTEDSKERRREEHLKRYANKEVRQRQLAKKREWNKKPASKAIQSRAKHLRRARERNAEIGDVSLIFKWEKTYRAKAKVNCYWCRGVFNGMDCHTDHIIPISRHGAHEIGNLCIACPTCNLRKHAKKLSEWNRIISEPVLL